LERLHRLAPTGTYTVSLPHEQEIQRLQSQLEKESAERHNALIKAEMYERDWYAAKSEFGTAMAKMREALRAAEKRELETLAELNEREADIQALRESRDKWAETARKLGEQLQWANDMACENTPTPGCECPGCSLARDRARRGVAGPEDER
jgi:septal ring factor EnvC (AmiA/AmiB activator)